MADFEWQGDGPDYTILAAGRLWRLNLEAPQPGLAWSDAEWAASLLSLQHVSTMGRCDREAFDAPSLVAFERHRGRIQASFAPPIWRGLTIRAAWEPTPAHDGFDLELQVSVSSSNVYRRLEVAIGSQWSRPPGAPSPDIAYRVEPRDVHAAALTYDGREPRSVLNALTTLPVPTTSPHTLPPAVCPSTGVEPPHAYIEMVRPDDCARRMIGERDGGDMISPRGFRIRYGLFGHDLEKGVVLRGRIRGIWMDSPAAVEEIRRQHEAFLREPPALGP